MGTFEKLKFCKEVPSHFKYKFKEELKYDFPFKRAFYVTVKEK